MSASSHGGDTRGDGVVDVRAIKKSIAFRAKYRKGQGEYPLMKLYMPGLVVPHPRNRGGDPCVSDRTRELANTVAKDGCDPNDAKSSAVAVEDVAADAAKRPEWGCFQAHFEKQVKGKDPGMASAVDGMKAMIGSLSHSHWNCLSRNIYSGTLGCACKSRGDGDTCGCKVATFLDPDGHYSIELLRASDAPWAELVEKGQHWEMLESAMDIEEPDAALVISIALNKRNEAAMSTAHTQIMRTLVGLCKPEPNGVPFEPIRSKMVDYYGAAVDHPDFYQAFRLIMDAGGAGSPHMTDLHDFTSVHVNPAFRNLRFECYAAVAVLPYNRPRLKNALIKWTWKQKPTRGWCPITPNIAYRFEPKGKFAMVDACDDIEGAIAMVHRQILAVAGTKILKNEQIKLFAEVDIALAALLINVPRTQEGKTLKEQEVGLKNACASTTLLKLDQFAEKHKLPFQDLVKDFDAQGNAILSKIGELAKKPFEIDNLRKKAAEESLKADNKIKKQQSAVAEMLAPKAADIDSQGNVMYEPETRLCKKKVEAEIIPWTGWLEGVEQGSDASVAKSILKTAIFRYADQFPLDGLPLSLVRTGNELASLATFNIEKGALRVPVHFRRDNGLIQMGKDRGAIHPKSVNASVALPTTAQERLAGMEIGETVVHICIQPELALPQPVVTGEERKWRLNDSVHPFWTIQRQSKNDEETNCEIAQQITTVVVATSPEGSLAGAQPDTSTVRVTIPVIVNTKAIKSGSPIVLKYQQPPKKSQQVQKDSKTWGQDLETQERKRQKKASSKEP